MKITTLLQVIAISFTANFTFAQFPGCPSVDAGPDQNPNCSTPCVDLTATPFDAGATTSYTVGSIPYNPPVAFGAPGGTGVSVGTDDVWSGVITLPFTFCYYGQTYTQCVIGSNGCISFNTGLASGFQPWSFSASCPSTALTSAGDIFGPYHDIDPSLGGSVQWYLLGTAPCRIFVVTFDNIPMFSCTSLSTQHMIVLYETTNAIDVYVNYREVCSSWNSGNAVIGIQNPAGTVGMAAPGRNTGPWGVTTPEGWRFLPSGAPIYTVDWYDGTTLIGSGNTINVCPVVPTTYTAQATYTSCDGNTIIETDDVVVTPSPGGMSVSEVSNTPASCGASNGGFEASATGGTAPYTYSLDNVTYQASGIFSNLPAGNYQVFAQDNSGCVAVINVTISDNSTLDMTLSSVTDVTCNGANDGGITAAPTGGTSPYTYTLNGGASTSSPSFTGLAAGTYTVEVTDNAGCTFSVDTTITEPTAIVITELSTTNTSCGQANGGFEVDATGGWTPYQYSIDGGTTNQGTGLYNNLSGGTYTVLVTDNAGCTEQLNVVVNDDPFPTLSVGTSNDVSCFGLTDGDVTLSVSSGVGPFTYTMDGGTPQSSATFSGLSAGTYTFEVTDANGCTSTINETIIEPAELTVTLGADFAVCEGTEVTISAEVNGGTGNYNYSWNVGGSTTSTVTQTPASSTTYTVDVTDANGCSANASQSVNVLPLPVALGDNAISTGYPPLTVTFNNLSSNATSYVWEFGNGSSMNAGDLSDVSSIYGNPGTYTVILTASNGLCDSTWTTEIIVNPYQPVEYEVPNVFTPNGDNENDLYYIDLKNARTIEVVIVNRWGNTMFEASSKDASVMNPAWDGTVNGNNADEGVYFIKYKITGLNLDEAPIEGHTFFHLMR